MIYPKRDNERDLNRRSDRFRPRELEKRACRHKMGEERPQGRPVEPSGSRDEKPHLAPGALRP